jgi:glucuronate isomerase
MTTVAILPESDPRGQKFYRAIAGKLQATGKTAGEALDALTAQLEDSEFIALLIIQNFRPDHFFTAEQQQRLSELMSLWRTARDQNHTLSPTQQAELDNLVEVELNAATHRTESLIEQLNK